MVIVDRGAPTWNRGFGVKDTASLEPITSDTIFTACSLTKPVFAYFVMKLSERGVLNLDTPLTKFSSERYLENDPRLDLITARHVLSHTTGFQNWREEDQQPLSIHFTPGEKFGYSGEGFSYLASVVTKLMGRPLETYMKTQILKPFGMSSTDYIWNERIGKRMAHPHDKSGRPREDRKRPNHESVARYGAAGDLMTTAVDYAKFLSEVIAPKPADGFRLTRETRDEMVRPQIKVPGREPISWALGWTVFQGENRDFVHHSGDDEGWHTFAIGCVANQSGYVAFTNGDGGAELLKRILFFESTQKFLRA